MVIEVPKRQNTPSCRNAEARRNHRRGSNCAAKPCRPSTQQNVKAPAAYAEALRKNADGVNPGLQAWLNGGADPRPPAFFQQFAEVRRQQFELGIALLLRQALRLRDEASERLVVSRDRRLDVVVRERIGGSVEDAILEVLLGLVFLDSRPRAEGLRRRGRARGDAAHERQGAPECKPTTVLILAGAGSGKQSRSISRAFIVVDSHHRLAENIRLHLSPESIFSAAARRAHLLDFYSQRLNDVE